MTLPKLTDYARIEHERITGAKRTIETEHSYIHEGIFFQVFDLATLATTATRNFVIQTPANLYLHYRNERVSSSGDKILIQLFEGTTLDAVPGGTPLTPFNHNRESGLNSATTVLINPTITDDGLQIAQSYIGGGTGVGGARSGEETSAANEWILSPATNYLVRITNGSTANNIINTLIAWYEEDMA